MRAPSRTPATGVVAGGAAPHTAPGTRADDDAGALAGGVAGLVMAMFAMAVAALQGHSIWTNPDLLAVMWMDPGVAGGRFTAATLVGLATHMATSVLMGRVAVPFIAGLRPWHTRLAAFSYTLASYPLVFATVLTWANPMMVARVDIVSMTAAHALFGLVLGSVYLWARARRAHR